MLRVNNKCESQHEIDRTAFVVELLYISRRNYPRRAWSAWSLDELSELTLSFSLLFAVVGTVKTWLSGNTKYCAFTLVCLAVNVAVRIGKTAAAGIIDARQSSSTFLTIVAQPDVTRRMPSLCKTWKTSSTSEGPGKPKELSACNTAGITESGDAWRQRPYYYVTGTILCQVVQRYLLVWWPRN